MNVFIQSETFSLTPFTGQQQNEALFSDDDSGDSTHPEDEESEGGETDEQEDEFMPDEQLERRPPAGSATQVSHVFVTS